MSLSNHLDALLSRGDADAAFQAWEKVSSTADQLSKTQPDDATTFKLLLEALPGFLKDSFSSAQG